MLYCACLAPRLMLTMASDMLNLELSACERMYLLSPAQCPLTMPECLGISFSCRVSHVWGLCTPCERAGVCACAGALVWWDGGFHRVADPLRHLGDGVASLPNPVGSPLDKARVGLFRLRTLLKSPAQILAGPETSTLARLQVLSVASEAPLQARFG